MPIDEDGLTEQRLRFCQYYVGEAEGNGTKAAELAGYSKGDSACVAASRLLSNVNIQKKIYDLKSERLAALEITDSNILKRIDEIGKMAQAKGEYQVALKALELLGRNRLWEKGGKGLRSLETSSDGTVKLIFEEDGPTNKEDNTSPNT